MGILRSRRRKGVGDSREEGKKGGEQTKKKRLKEKEKEKRAVHVERSLASALLAD